MLGLNPLTDEILKEHQEIIDELRARVALLQIDLENLTAQRNRLEAVIKNILEIVISHMELRPSRS